MADSYIIEMLWDCGACGHRRIGGLTRACPKCFHEKDAHDREYMPDDTSAAAALPAERLKEAEGRPDWACPTCGTRVRAGADSCPECADDRSAAATRSFESFRAAVRAATRDDPPRRAALVAVVFGVVALLALGGYTLFRTRVVRAEVVAVSWEHRVHIDRYRVLQDEGWIPDSAAFDVRNMGPRIHHYDRVVAGTHQEPYQDRYACGQDCRTVLVPRNCRSRGDGTAECSSGGTRQDCNTKYCTRTLYKTVTDYRQEPRYQTWYAWNYWGWKFHRTVQDTGRTTATTWPEGVRLEAVLSAGEKERTRREATYAIVFEERGLEPGEKPDTWTLAPKSEGEFRQYRPGQRETLEVNALGIERIVPSLAEAPAN